MSRTRRNFSAKFKSELVIELLKEEKDLNTIATENNIQPNLLRNWKKEFLDKACHPMSHLMMRLKHRKDKSGLFERITLLNIVRRKSRANEVRLF